MLTTTQLVSRIAQLSRNSSGVLTREHVDFKVDQFLNLVEGTPLRIVESSDGKISVVQETGDRLDFSRQSRSFDLHIDGLYHKNIPDFVILFCVNPGLGETPSIFSDSRVAIEQIHGTQSWKVLKKLEMVYINKDSSTVSHPLIEKHPQTGESVIYLGTRAFIRPWLNVEQLASSPPLRGIVSAMTDLYNSLDNAMVLKHYWKQGDLVIFDNHTYMHGREAQDKDPERKLLRIWLSFR